MTVPPATSPKPSTPSPQPSVNPTQVFADFDRISDQLQDREKAIEEATKGLAEFKTKHPDFNPNDDLRQKEISGGVADKHEKVDAEIRKIHEYNALMRKKYPDLPQDETLIDKIKKRFGKNSEAKETKSLSDQKDELFKQIQTLLPDLKEIASLCQHPSVVKAIAEEQTQMGNKYGKQTDEELQEAQRKNQVALAKAYSAIPDKTNISAADMDKLAPLLATDQVINKTLTARAEAKATAAAAATQATAATPTAPTATAAPRSNVIPERPGSAPARSALPASPEVAAARERADITPRPAPRRAPGSAPEMNTNAPNLGRR